MITTQQLEAYFTYHAPTEEQKPKYKAIRDVVAQAGNQITSLFSPGEGPELQEAYEVVNTSLRECARNILEFCPASADRTTAIRCLRAARMMYNEALTVWYQIGLNKDMQTLNEEEKLRIYQAGQAGVQEKLQAMTNAAATEITQARMWASAAIALEEK